MSNAQAPSRTDIPAISWSSLRFLLAPTVAITVTLLIALTAYTVHITDSSITDSIAIVAADPYTLAATFFSARGIAFFLHQRRRDMWYSTQNIQTPAPVSMGVLVITVSFSLVGLVSAFIAWPYFYETSTEIRILAIPISGIAASLGYFLLTYRLSDLIASDRHQRHFRVQPALWQFFRFAPIVGCVWMVLFDISMMDVPTNTVLTALGIAPVGPKWTSITPWGMAYLALLSPTLLTILYLGRRAIEAVVK